MSVGTETAADRAHEYLRGAIMRGELTGGTMLSENELAARLSMSRTPVRAALVRLQQEGWVTIYPQRGALVRSIELGELQESAQMRHALETCGVHRSTEHTRSRARATLTENLAQQESVLASGAFDGFAPLALQFHRGFVELAQNQLMLVAYDRLQDRQLFSINQSAPRIAGDPALVIAEHRTLMTAALDGDQHAFSDALDAHQTRSHGFEDGRPG
ncbi:GntR family transcriptional regulator [Nocardioides sp. JQ2195]|uniref:GntR family transcriptional regulator n=1 Tax=Nocardioides sp. JQ2195 TaxID=2592334 RepID=UPI00143E79A3|nr:GntR family transcriptional regulator [Nocardioides sp. JQ2195]QIX26469.1 GntR family transcriptional regulator [Nocardioides sp. JQ2195]